MIFNYLVSCVTSTKSTCVYVMYISVYISLTCSVFHSVHITTLNVGFNKLSSLPADIGLLTSLSVLDLRYCLIAQPGA